MTIRHDAPSALETLLRSRGIALKKRFGQNFLVDRGARERIAAEVLAAGVGAGAIWEVGPGLGALTDELDRSGAPLVLFEVDHGLIGVLRDRYGDRIPIVAGDAAVTVPKALETERAPSVICGNLPYRSASAIIAAIVESAAPAVPLVFLVQQELADRLSARPGGKDYAAITILAQLRYVVTPRFALGGSAFYPRPRVGSRVVTLRPRSDAASRDVRLAASRIARAAFGQRRKTMRNTVPDALAAMERIGLSGGARPEELAPDHYVEIARAISSSRDATSGDGGTRGSR